jgi:hypothetical protein
MKHRWFQKAGLMALIVAIAIAFAIPAAQAGEYWQQKYERFSATAGETLAIGDVVCVKATDGEAYKADANDSALRPAVGVIGKGGASSATVEIVIRGVLGGQAVASPGVRLFLSETAGAMTPTAPTNEQAVGIVMPEPGETAESSIYYINVIPPQNNGAGY